MMTPGRTLRATLLFAVALVTLLAWPRREMTPARATTFELDEAWADAAATPQAP